MAQYFQIHPETPQPRLIKQTVQIIASGGVVVYPTDSCYAIGCHIGDKSAMDRIRRIRRLDDNHNFTLVSRDLSQVSLYAKIENEQYRLIKAHTPGPYTFILSATRQVPRRLQHPKRKTIGLRIPDSNIVSALLLELKEPLMSSTLILPGQRVLSDPLDIRDCLEHEVDLVVDGGYCGIEPTTVVQWLGDTPEITRIGLGDPTPFQ